MPARYGRGIVELRHLKYFQAIANDAGFSRAATRLRVAQPALSRQIRALEKELGTDLLVRTAKGVVPTRAGEVLLRGAGEILGRWRKVFSALSERVADGPGSAG